MQNYLYSLLTFSLLLVFLEEHKWYIYRWNSDVISLSCLMLMFAEERKDQLSTYSANQPRKNGLKLKETLFRLSVKTTFQQ